MKVISYEYYKEHKNKLLTKEPKYDNNRNVYISSIKYTVVKPIDNCIDNGWRYQLYNTYTGVSEYAYEKDMTKNIFTDD